MQLIPIASIQQENHTLISAIHHRNLIFCTWRSSDPKIGDVDKAYKIEGYKLIELNQQVADISPIAIGKHYLASNPAPYRIHIYEHKDNNRIEETSPIAIDMYEHLNKIIIGDDYLLTDTQGYANREIKFYRPYGSQWVEHHKLSRSDFGMLGSWSANRDWLVLDVPDVYTPNKLMFYQIDDEQLTHHQEIEYMTTIDSDVILVGDVCLLHHEMLEVYHYIDDQWKLIQLIELPSPEKEYPLAISSEIFVVGEPTNAKVSLYRCKDGVWKKSHALFGTQFGHLVSIQDDSLLIGSDIGIHVYLIEHD